MNNEESKSPIIRQPEVRQKPYYIIDREKLRINDAAQRLEDSRIFNILEEAMSMQNYDIMIKDKIDD